MVFNSFHEMAVYDVPMIIDLMLSETGTEKVFYIGHSLGAMVYPVAVAEQPELNDKIHASFSFGSGGVPVHSISPAKMSSILLDLEPSILVNFSLVVLFCNYQIYYFNLNYNFSSASNQCSNSRTYHRWNSYHELHSFEILCGDANYM